jgi:mitogen-activated protein kinase kinase
MATTVPPAPLQIRKKRNFKALQLDVAQKPPPTQPASAPTIQTQGPDSLPVPTRLAPTPAQGARPGGKKKPPMMDLSKSRPKPLAPAHAPGSPTGNGGTSPGISLVVPGGPNSAPATGTPSSRPTYQTTLQQQLADLEINGDSDRKLDLKLEDLIELSDLGHGNGGSVKKVKHTPSGLIMAKKVR